MNYIIINADKIQERIKELEKIKNKEIFEHMEYDTLKNILSNSIPLIPEMEKAFNEGENSKENEINGDGESEFEDYISQLKFNI